MEPAALAAAVLQAAWRQLATQPRLPPPLRLPVKLLESPGQAIAIESFRGKAVEPPVAQAVANAIQVGVGVVWSVEGGGGRGHSSGMCV